jgi:hypothetical protein
LQLSTKFPTTSDQHMLHQMNEVSTFRVILSHSKLSKFQLQTIHILFSQKLLRVQNSQVKKKKNQFTV